MASPSTLLGAAGEHFVMSMLLRRGFVAALAPAGVPNSDILVTDDLGDRLCAIQVKSRLEKGRDGGWHMRAKHEHISAPFLFYVFVDFGASLDQRPSSFIIPSATVAEVIRTSHSLWLATPGKQGQSRSDGELRRLLPDYDRVGLRFGRGANWLEPFRENWDALSAVGS